MLFQVMNRVSQPAAVMLSWTVLFVLLPLCAYGRTAGEVLGELKNTRGKAREAKLVEGARREGKVVLYGTTGVDDMKEIFDGFKRRYPFLEVGHYRGGALKVYNKVVAEARAGRYEADVLESTSLTGFHLKEQNLLDPYISPSRDGLLKDFMDREGYWTAWFQQVVVMVYNTTLVKKSEVPRSYEDLLNPKWRGKLSMDDEDDDLFGTLLDHWGKEKGLAYFRKLAQNKPTMRKGHNLQTNLLAAGETHIAPWIFAFRPLVLKQKGAPLDIALLNPVISDPKQLMLAKNSSRPHAAALFIDWLLTDGQKMIVEKFGRTSTRPGLNERFSELALPDYLVVKPERLGPNSKEYAELYCKTFGHC
ncbi:MAG: extracellular solute-binding protein [Deltaproteobacteria bacterium]|nr:extracellular solute-binding protein [Deltaproteobacteria bacterium]